MSKLVANSTRIWVYCGTGTPGELGGDDVALNVIEGTALQSNLNFRDQYVAAGGQERGVQLPGNRYAQLGLLGRAAATDEARPAAGPGCFEPLRPWS